MEQPLQQLQDAAEQTLALFDTYWFHRLVLLPPPPPPSSPPPPPPPPQPSPELSKEAERFPSLRHRRSRSDEAAATAFEQLLPLKILGNRARLETILSGREALDGASQPERRRPEVPRRRRRRWRGRSMSELEFEEVKGLRDLGFTFSDAEVDAELASIVPGLRRRRPEEAPAAAGDEGGGEVAAAADVPGRPYLSEAWDAKEDEEAAAVGRVLQNWRIPAAGEGVDLKEHLRLWAHTVASAVR